MNNCHTCHNVSCNTRGGDFGPCEEYIPKEPDDSFTAKDMRIMGIFCLLCGLLIGTIATVILIHFM